MRDADQQTLHISHPRPTSGPLISDFLSKTLQLPVVPYAEWLARLQKSAGEGHSPSGVDANPALGLLDYFHSLEIGSNAGKEALGLPKLSVVEGQKASSALRNAADLTTRDVEQWLANWEKAGFLSL